MMTATDMNRWIEYTPSGDRNCTLCKSNLFKQELRRYACPMTMQYDDYTQRQS
jgi:hypothetical protein